MIMERICLLLYFFSLPFFILAQQPEPVPSEIVKVAVYRQGAQVVRSAQAALQEGVQTLRLGPLPYQLDENSIQLKVPEGALLIALSQQVDYLNEGEADSLAAGLKQAQLALQDSIRWLKQQQQVYEAEKEMLARNQELGGNNGLSVEELKRGAELYRSRLMDIAAQTERLQLRGREFKLALVRLSRQLLELNAQTEALPERMAIAVVQAPKPMQARLELSYVIPDAGWEPFYNLRAHSTEAPLMLDYRAHVYQRSGEDWEKVALTLSTGNPNISNAKPELPPYRLTFNNYYAPPPQPAISGATRQLSGLVLDAEANEPLIGASIVLAGTNQGAVTGIDGRFQMEVPVGTARLEVQYIGYESQEVQVSGSNVTITMQGATALLDEIVVTGMRSKSSRKQAPAKPKAMPVAIEKHSTSTTFDIELPYSIPSDNKPYDVQLAQHEVPAVYHLAAVPKRSQYAYLVAGLPDWEQYNLLSGQANLFFKGGYQGKVPLDLSQTGDTLTVSLGRDEGILIKRALAESKSSVPFLGNTRTVEKHWEITVRNTNDYSVELEIEDQYPLAQQDEIKVVQLGHSGAVHNEQTGQLTWRLPLAPRSQETVSLKYAVRYPKKMRLLVD
ncbi:mucoidy inhibitor MuiA family protein [Phaeodactylibacter luteus]|uniref:Mucoidy inhibitor MuiA family protein n=2 Tax=Phaeodactylibacter luteus TaxID=1564516 RepID=A0A5C6RLR7_9BACT|nr:mucoidy inhibitor MuiA family protein [Phaeodactylibacter luteus]